MSDLLLREGAIAVLSTLVPVDVRHNSVSRHGCCYTWLKSSQAARTMAPFLTFGIASKAAM